MSWGEIKKINSDPATPLDVTLGKKTDVAGTTATSSMFSWLKSTLNNTNTINTNINAIKASNLLNFGSAVKRIQRGTVAHSNTSSASRTISVASVDMSKSYLDVVVYFSKAFTLFYAITSTSGAANASESIYLSSSTVITQPYSYIIEGTNRYYYLPFTWQLIELY